MNKEEHMNALEFKLKESIAKKDVKEIRSMSEHITPAKIADLLEDLTQHERVIFFRLLNKDKLSDVFAQLEPEFQEMLVADFSDQQIKDVVGDLYTDEIADLIEDFPANLAKRILENTPRDVREDVNKILNYDDDQVGSIMTVDIVVLQKKETVATAIRKIKAAKNDAYLGHYFVVVDEKDVLQGVVTGEKLLFAKNTQKIKDLMEPSGYVKTTSTKEEAAIIYADNDKSVLPVVDEFREVIGVITSDDMVDVIQAVATEDFHKIAGVKVEDGVPYSKMKIRSLFKSRVMWLMLLMISSTLSQMVLDLMMSWSNAMIVSSLVSTAIVAILPVISGAAGNAGSQSSTMVIRALAVGDITSKDYLKVFNKELKVSSLVGVALAVANFARLMIYYAATGELIEETMNFVFLSMGASIALFVVIVLAKIVGGMLPLLAKRLKLDPAVMAAPLLTTLIDALSTLIFFSISVGIMLIVLN